MCATRLVPRGASLPVVKELLGHSVITTTMRYAYPTPESKKNALALLEKATASREEMHVQAIPA